LLTAATVACGDDGVASDGTEGGTGTGSTGAADSSGGPSTSGAASTGGSGADDTGTTGDPGGSSSDGSDSGSTGAGVELTPEELLAGVEHIIVLCMENRSFDHYLGSLQLVEGHPDVDGLTGTESNPDQNGVPVDVFEMDNLEVEDPPHGWDACHGQWNAGANDGFVVEHFNTVGDALKHEVMGYHTREHLPVTYALADAYTVCDAWFCSLLSQTWPNRYYLHAVDSNGSTNNTPALPGPTSIQDLCSDNGVSNRNYYDGIAAWRWGAYPITGFSGTASIGEFFDKLQNGGLEQVVILDPDFLSNDDHPAHNVTLGQTLIGTIYQALAASQYWDNTLLIITYDEHGGFYDHVAPPTTVDDNGPEYAQMGFRVPSLVIGPHVRKGFVNHEVFEHGSFAATVATRFGLPPLNDRMAATADVSSCIDPEYVDNPQPPTPLPMMTIRESVVLAGAGDVTSQPELYEGLGIAVPLQGDDRRRHRQSLQRLLHEAERHKVARVIRDLPGDESAG
jgi:phospholipase C